VNQLKKLYSGILSKGLSSPKFFRLTLWLGCRIDYLFYRIQNDCAEHAVDIMQSVLAYLAYEDDTALNELVRLIGNFQYRAFRPISVEQIFEYLYLEQDVKNQFDCLAIKYGDPTYPLPIIRDVTELVYWRMSRQIALRTSGRQPDIIPTDVYAWFCR
jgi:hypothetical protein